MQSYTKLFFKPPKQLDTLKGDTLGETMHKFRAFLVFPFPLHNQQRVFNCNYSCDALKACNVKCCTNMI